MCGIAGAVSFIEDMREDMKIYEKMQHALLRRGPDQRGMVLKRQAALILSKSLKKGQEAISQGERDSQKVISIIRESLESEPLARIDYVEVVDFENIQRTAKIEGETLVAIAVYIGKTRLIDNFIVNL